MKNVWVAFDVLADSVVPPSDHQYMRCHMIFDVCCPACSLGAYDKGPSISHLCQVVSQETMHIALLGASLNKVDIWAADVLNAYITAPCHEKIWTTLGREFGDDCSQKAIIF
ncbi:LOW QUALITY PROTEIN: hypothetical protein ACHAW6_001234 [Cyclotella cf. meneghiniana]